MPCNVIHSKQTAADGIHIIHSFEYADAIARLAATGFTSVDVGKVAKQTDNLSWWLLTDDSPITWSEITPTGLSSALWWSNSSVGGTTTTRYLTLGSGSLAQTTPIQHRLPRGGTLKSLYIHHNSPGGNGNAIVYTVRINGVATLLTVSLASTGADGSDLANSVVVSAGDLIDIEVAKAAGVAAGPSDISATLALAA